MGGHDNPALQIDDEGLDMNNQHSKKDHEMRHGVEKPARENIEYLGTSCVVIEQQLKVLSYADHQQQRKHIGKQRT